MLRGYRSTDRGLLAGPWLPGELLGLPLPDWPALAAPTAVAPPAGPDDELCVVPGVAFVRFAELDWVHRRARLEIGVAPGPAPDADLLVKSAVAHAVQTLGLRRLHGWVTPTVDPPTAALAAAGFRREATVPEAVWLDGGPRTREVWGLVHHG
jgi:hypothetical protein